MELDFKTYDIVKAKEDEIERIISKKSKTTNIPELAQRIKDNKDIVMVRTLMSILFKARSKSIWMKNKVPKSSEYEQDTIFMTEELMKIIYLTLNRRGIKGIEKLLLENASVTNDILLKYFSDKNTNYISEKFFIETILDHRNSKEILTLNPFIINELLNYQKKPLTYEENIIREMVDYYIEAQQYYDSPKDIEYVKKLFKKNTSHIKQKEDELMFMISDVYQEAQDRQDYEFYRTISKIVEANNFDIINYLYQNKLLVSQIIKKFVEYNINIEEGRLEELDKKPSSAYARRIYRKNP